MTGAHCAMNDCSNGCYRLERWQKTHDCKNPSEDKNKKCGCEPPFILHNFPTEKKYPEERKRWIKVVNRQVPQEGKPAKPWVPTKNSRICSEHFPGGAPSKEYPDPCLKLGYHDIRSLSSCKKRKAPTVRTTPTPAPQRKRLNLEVLEAALQEIQQEPENLLHMDHNYMQPQIPPVCMTKPDPECVSKCEPVCGPKHEVEDMPVDEPAAANACEACAQKQTELDELAAKFKILTISQKAKQKYERCSNLIKTDDLVRRNTGLQNKEVFNKMLEFVTPKASRMRYWEGPKRVVSSKVRKYKKTPTKCGPKRKLSVKEEFVMVLMKLREGLKNQLLGAIFDVTESTCSRIVHTWVRFLAHELKNLVFWPEKEHIQQVMPAALARAYPNLRCIIDCSETNLQRPRDLKLQSATWSDYKHNNTLKYLVAIAPNGHISFISQAWGGRTTDRHIVQNSKFLDLIEPYDMVMADRGFPIQEDLLFRRASLVIPPSSSGKDQMCKANVLKTKKIANTRIHVERAINRLKWFKIISRRLPITMAYMFDDILLICAALCNLLPPLIV